jgi:hypothetical protein
VLAHAFRVCRVPGTKFTLTISIAGQTDRLFDNSAVTGSLTTGVRVLLSSADPDPASCCCDRSVRLLLRACTCCLRFALQIPRVFDDVVPALRAAFEPRSCACFVSQTYKYYEMFVNNAMNFSLVLESCSVRVL